MIQKVSGQDSLAWVNDEESIQRDSMNKQALSSFETVLVATAQKQIKDGKSIDEIAAAFNMSAADLHSIVFPSVNKVASSNGETKIAAQENTSNEALDAYNSLHSVKASTEEIPEFRNGKSVISAMAENITEMGGPKRRVMSQNSIWDSEVIDKLAKQKDNGEIIREARDQENKRRENIKAASRDERIDLEGLKTTIQQKDVSVQNLSGADGNAHKYTKKLPVSGMSIFDTVEFGRLAEQTEGEKLSANKPAPKERVTTESLLPANNSRSITASMFDNIFEKTGDKE